MTYSGVKDYLSKTIHVLKDLLPNNAFLHDKDEIELISGAKFEKGCKRSQMRKSDTFGVESKIGLYRVAWYGPDATGTPHWTFLINCDSICKRMCVIRFQLCPVNTNTGFMSTPLLLGQVSLPNLKWLEVPETTINKLIESLVANTINEFKPNGSLRQILRASIASLIMYD